METAPGRRGKVRDEGLRAAILAAASEVLLEKGYKGFTIEGVAQKSGASKVTIYRWWTSKGTIALDAYFEYMNEAIAFPQTESAREDIERQLRSVIHYFTKTPSGTVIRELIGGAQEDPALKRELTERYIQPRRELAARAFARWLGWDLETNRERLALITDQVYGAIYNRLLFGLEPLDDDFAKRLVGCWANPREF